MRSSCQVGIQRKLSFSLQCCCCCYISTFQLRTITGFTGKAGFICPDTGKQDLGHGCLKSYIQFQFKATTLFVNISVIQRTLDKEPVDPQGDLQKERQVHVKIELTVF